MARKVGLVGFGSIAEHSHVPAWQSLEDVEVVAVADVSSQRLESARALLPKAALYDHPLDLIRTADVDIVDICTPPTAHTEALIAACFRGIPDIVCEKPFVLNVEDYARVARARHASGSHIVSVNNWVHSDLNRHVSGALHAGAIGTVRAVDLDIGRPDCALGSEGWNPRWRTDMTYAGGGIILDHGWHQFYLLMGWMGRPVESVTATTRTANPKHFPVEDEARIELVFSNGRGTIQLAWTAERRTNSGTIRGDRGTIRSYDDRILIENGGAPRSLPFGSKLSVSSYHPEWFAAVFQYNVLNDERDRAGRNFAEAGSLVSVVQAAYRSARRGGEPCRPLPVGSNLMPSEETAEINGCSSGGL